MEYFQNYASLLHLIFEQRNLLPKEVLRSKYLHLSKYSNDLESILFHPWSSAYMESNQKKIRGCSLFMSQIGNEEKCYLGNYFITQPCAK